VTGGIYSCQVWLEGIKWAFLEMYTASCLPHA
jgi:hypothetical protein